MKKILVVDDDPNIRELTRMILDNEGYSVITTENGTEAVEKAKKENPHLILMDIVMPGLDGVDACKVLKNSSLRIKSIPVIMFTALDEMASRKKAEDAGCDGYFIKPFTPEKFVTGIKRILRN